MIHVPARMPVLVAALAALAGCSSQPTAQSPAAPATPYEIATFSPTEPVWGQGWVQQDSPWPVQRPDAAANEHLANRMAAAYSWTGPQASCLDSLWAKVSDFDPYWTDDLFNGIAGLSGHVIDPSLPAYPSAKDLQASGWYAAQPGLQVAQGLADIQVFWGSPCAEWAADKNAPAASYPPGRTFGGSLVFIVTGGRLALSPETFQWLCGLPGLPVPDPPKSCAHITQATTWPMS